MTSQPSPDTRSLADLTKALSEQSSRLVKDEIALAKAEIVGKAKRAGVGLACFGGAAMLAGMMLGALVAAAIAALSLALATWLAGLVVAGVCVIVAAMLVLAGARAFSRATPPMPEEARDSAKEDVRWAKVRAQQARR